MKALVYHGAGDIRFEDAAEPAPRQGEVVVQVESVGICGSDMHAYLGHDERRPPPLILGHEAAGIVVAAPDAASEWKGRRVTINPLVTCGSCPACRAGRDNLCPDRQIISMPPRPGAFGERVAIPTRNLVEIPEGVPTAKAALAEPIACGRHAVRLGRAAAGEGPLTRALVLGGGAIGLGAALSLACQGIADVTIVEPNAMRRAFLSLNCGQNAVPPETIETAPAFDMVIDGVGIEATRTTASALVRPGGVIMHIGLGSSAGGLDVRRMTLQEITFIGTYTYTAQDFRDTAQAIFDGRLGALDWLETRSLLDGVQAFEDIRTGRVAAPKIILQP